VRVSTPRHTSTRQSHASGAALNGTSPGASAVAPPNQSFGTSAAGASEGWSPAGRTVQGWLDQVEAPCDDGVGASQDVGGEGFVAPTSFAAVPGNGLLLPPPPADVGADDDDSVLVSPLGGKSPDVGKRSKLIRDAQTGELRRKTASEEAGSSSASSSSSSSSSSSTTTATTSSAATTGTLTASSATDSSPASSPNMEHAARSKKRREHALAAAAAKASRRDGKRAPSFSGGSSSGSDTTSSDSSSSSSSSEEEAFTAGAPQPPANGGPIQRRPSSGAIKGPGSPVHLPRPPSQPRPPSTQSVNNNTNVHPGGSVTPELQSFAVEDRPNNGGSRGSQFNNSGASAHLQQRPRSHSSRHGGSVTPGSAAGPGQQQLPPASSGAEARGLSRGSNRSGGSNRQTPPAGPAAIAAANRLHSPLPPVPIQPSGPRVLSEADDAVSATSSSNSSTSDDDATSASSSTSSDVTTTSASTTTSVATTTTATASTDVGDDDVLYAKLVGLNAPSAPLVSAEAGGAGREAKLRTMVGNVWRGLRSRIRRAKKSGGPGRVHDEATQELIAMLLRERHQFRHAAQLERDHRHAAQEKAEEQQRVVDRLIARGLSRGASGAGAIVTSLYGDPDKEKRERRARRKARKDAAGAASPEPTESDPPAIDTTSSGEKTTKRRKKSKTRADDGGAEQPSAEGPDAKSKRKKRKSKADAAEAPTSPPDTLTTTSAKRAPTAPLVLPPVGTAAAGAEAEEAPPGATPRPRIRGHSAGAVRQLDAQRPTPLDLSGGDSGGVRTTSAAMCAGCAKYGGVAPLLQQIEGLKSLNAALRAGGKSLSRSTTPQPAPGSTAGDQVSPKGEPDPPQLPVPSAAKALELPPPRMEDLGNRTIAAQRRPSETRVEDVE